MYIEPSWTTLIINGTVLRIIEVALVLLLTLIIINIGIKIMDHMEVSDDAQEWIIPISTGTLFILLVLISVPITSMVWNEWMEEPSKRTDTITIQEIQPMPGVLNENKNTITSADQLIFITTDGREFKNTEYWIYNKFETRTIFNTLRVGGTYKITYYGWRNGYDNDFPNIISVDEIIDENNTQPNDYKKYFGRQYGSQYLNLYEE